MQTADGLLRAARARLREIESPALDARLLLQAATGLTAEQLIADPAHQVSHDDATTFHAMVERRVLHEPVTRILGEREFFGRAFHVTPDVLDPRADTEVVVELALKHLPQHQHLRLLDLGTGSGAIPVTLLAERSVATGVAIDISQAALVVASRNASRHGVADRLVCVESDWFQRVEGRFHLIISNPPYIPAGDIEGLEDDVKLYDPHLALVGGVDGLACYRQIARGCARYLEDGAGVVVEIGAGQSDAVRQIFANHGFSLADQAHDLGGHLRALMFVQQVK